MKKKINNYLNIHIYSGLLIFLPILKRKEVSRLFFIVIQLYIHYLLKVGLFFTKKKILAVFIPRSGLLFRRTVMKQIKPEQMIITNSGKKKSFFSRIIAKKNFEHSSDQVVILDAVVASGDTLISVIDSLRKCIGSFPNNRCSVVCIVSSAYLFTKNCPLYNYAISHKLNIDLHCIYVPKKYQFVKNGLFSMEKLKIGDFVIDSMGNEVEYEIPDYGDMYEDFQKLAIV